MAAHMIFVRRRIRNELWPKIRVVKVGGWRWERVKEVVGIKGGVHWWLEVGENGGGVHRWMEGGGVKEVFIGGLISG